MSRSDSSEPLSVVFFLPDVHFYAPLVIREICGNGSEINAHFVLTPKFSRADGSGWSILELIRNKGVRYLLSQASLRLMYRLNHWRERLMSRAVSDRDCPEVPELCRTVGESVTRVDSVGDPELQAWVEERSSDLITAVFFNQIIPESLLNLAEHGAYNLHPGSLPSYRGYSPVFWQLLNEEGEAAVTLHEMTSELDGGGIYGEKRTEIGPSDSYFSLYRRLALGGAELMKDLLGDVKQDHSLTLTDQKTSDGSPYKSFRRRDIGNFFETGRRFWHWRDLLSSPEWT